MTCRYCLKPFDSTRADAVYCSNSHRALASAQRRDALRRDLVEFRATIGDLLSRYSDGGDLATLRTLAAEAAALTPTALGERAA
jgi:hypothetical protein